jgi:hypothetical protein
MHCKVAVLTSSAICFFHFSHFSGMVFVQIVIVVAFGLVTIDSCIRYSYSQICILLNTIIYSPFLTLDVADLINPEGNEDANKDDDEEEEDDEEVVGESL